MVLVATASCAALASAVRIGTDPSAAMLVAGNILLLGALVTARLAGLLRGLLLAAFACSLAWMTAHSATENAWLSPIPFFSPAILLASLGALVIWDLSRAIRNHSSARSYRVWGFAAALCSMMLYMVIVPSIDAFLEQFRERPASYTIEELTLLESLRIRSAKFAVFAIFTYVGACWGSFLNVVAFSLPRKQSIALRSSACPQCGAPLRRIDNLPVFSYLNLGGRCRACGARIPIRYLIVELIAAAIFASLFLYELVTGAANVPGFPHYHYTGIVWIILYTKWPVIGIYFYHATLFCCLLTLALMEMDRKRCPRWFAWSLLLVLSALPVAVATLQPVAFDTHLPIDLHSRLPPPVAQTVACVIGGVFGWLFGGWLLRMRVSKRTRNLPLAFSLIGIALGWQTAVTIGAVSAITYSLLSVASQPKRWVDRLGATAGLLLVAMIHHPFWKLIASLW